MNRLRRVSSAAAMAVLLCGAMAQAQTASTTDLTGSWQGMLDVGKGQRIVLQVHKDGAAGWKGLMYNLDGYQPETGRNTTAMSFDGGDVQFAVGPLDVKYEGKLSADGKEVVGQWTQAGTPPHALTLVRADGDAAWALPQTKKAMAADADPGWEVVSVHKGDPNNMNSGIQMQGRDVVIERKSVETMLLFGYGVHKTQILNAPDWVRSEIWDVKGYPDVPGQPSIPQFQSLVRKALVERFGLVSHTEKRDLSVYALTVGKGGPKMEKSAGEANQLPTENDHDNGGQRIMQMGNMKMRELSLILTYFMDRPVVDKTGLDGRYDFLLKYTSDEMKAPTDGTALPTIFTAIQEQLGLKLEPVKTATDVMVIDKVERPGEN